MSNHLMKLVGAVAVVLTLVGCASGVSRQAGSLETTRISTERISQVVIRLSPEAQNKSVDNRGFSSDPLASENNIQIGNRNMLDTASATPLDVEVTDFRVRSTAAAVMFGFMAGDDSLLAMCGFPLSTCHGGFPVMFKFY